MLIPDQSSFSNMFMVQTLEWWGACGCILTDASRSCKCLGWDSGGSCSRSRLSSVTLNAKAAINRFRVSLKRVHCYDKLQGASEENALRTVHTQANELELMALTPLAHCLANLFTTPKELPCVTSAKEWERLSSEEFRIHALLSESCRLTENLRKQLILKMTRSTKVEESSICRQPQMSLILPSPHSTTANTYLFPGRLS